MMLWGAIDSALSMIGLQYSRDIRASEGCASYPSGLKAVDTLVSTISSIKIVYIMIYLVVQTLYKRFYN